MGFIVAGFGAIGKTTLGEKYPNVIDLESGYFQWDNTGHEHIPYEKRKGKTNREKNKNWPQNYFEAILAAQEKYDVVLTSMHWDLLEFYESNNIEYYIAFPKKDSGLVLEKRCYGRGNNDVFTNKLLVNLVEYQKKLQYYKPKKILYIEKEKFLEDVLVDEEMLISL